MPDAKFGTAVGVVGGDVLVGAPLATFPRGTGQGGGTKGAAYVFDPASGALVLRLVGTQGDGRFGTAVAGLGSKIIVGAPGEDASNGGGGRVYVFDGNTGARLLTLEGLATVGSLGASVTGFGTRIVAGAPDDATRAAGAGAAYVFDAASGALLQPSFRQAPTTGGRFGSSVAASNDRMLVGSPEISSAGRSGVVYVFSPLCGDGAVDAGERCDDGNVAAGDCCSPTCQFDPAGASCGSGCDASNVCDGAGRCRPR